MKSNKPKTFGAYQPIVKTDNHYFIAGQVGVDSSTKAASSNIEEQVKQAMANLGAVLASHDLGYEHLVKTTLYLVNIDDFTSVNMVYENYFKGIPLPARSTIGVKELPKVAGDTKLLFEIEAIAYKGGVNGR